MTASGLIGSANLDWKSHGFRYIPTAGHVRFRYRDGAWDQGRFLSDPNVPMHILSNVFHYGQGVIDGLKAYQQMDGSVAVFRGDAHLRRMNHSLRTLDMPELSKAEWNTAINEVIWHNLPYIPPFETGCALYIRPYCVGSGKPCISLHSSTEFIFNTVCSPIGSYFPSMAARVLMKSDRAAPYGVGSAKVAGNYAIDLRNFRISKEKGFGTHLYLDPVEKRYIQQFNTFKFVAITKDGTYITADSPVAGIGVTNPALRKIAEHEYGLKVEMRQIDFLNEVDTFVEVGAVRTAGIVSPITKLVLGDKEWKFEKFDVLGKIRLHLNNIQRGIEEDKYGFNRVVVGAQCDTLEDVRQRSIEVPS